MNDINTIFSLLNSIVSLIDNYKIKNNISDNKDNIDLLFKINKFTNNKLDNVSDKIDDIKEIKEINNNNDNLFKSYEHNLYINNPSNGYYIRWKNDKFQVCFDKISIKNKFFDSVLEKTIIYPANFLEVRDPFILSSMSNDFEIKNNTNENFNIKVSFKNKFNKDFFIFYYITIGNW